MESLVPIIVNYGACGVMLVASAWFIKYMYDTSNKMITNMNAEHREETDKLRDVLERNTSVIKKLADQLEQIWNGKE